jgi:hypothetical protein
VRPKSLFLWVFRFGKNPWVFCLWQKPVNTSVLHSRWFPHLRASAAWARFATASGLYWRCPENSLRETSVCHPYRTLVRRRSSGALAEHRVEDPLMRERWRWQMPMSICNENNQANRAISTGKLHALPHFHTRPINVVVFHGSDREHSFSGWFPA